MTATIKDVMDSVVDPSADAIWGSVSETVSEAGIETRQPRTDEDWVALRRHTIALAEGANLLLMPDRRVARPGERAENQNVELAPEEIQAVIDRDRETWVNFVHALQDATAPVMNAIERRNVEALIDGGEGLDKACENCHLKYWYPPRGGTTPAANR